MSQREWNNEPKQRWLVTTREFRAAEGHEVVETTEIEQHPVDYLNELQEVGIAAELLYALKLHPEDPRLNR